MTVSVQLETISDAITSLSISGVHVVDVDHVPENALDYCPLLYPRPDGFVTDILPEVQSFGSDTQRKVDLSYTLNFRYLHAPIGSGAVLQNYAGILSKLVLILQTILSNSTPGGSVDVSIQSVSDLGPLTDVAGNVVYHGVDFSIRVKEFVQ